MWIGILIFAALCELIGIWFVEDRAGFSIGLLLGAVLSCAASYHMWLMLDKSLGIYDDKTAGRRVAGGYIIRYTALIALIVVLYFTGWGSPFAAFIGYMGMKPAAYAQPAIHRFIHGSRQS